MTRILRLWSLTVSPFPPNYDTASSGVGGDGGGLDGLFKSAKVLQKEQIEFLLMTFPPLVARPFFLPHSKVNEIYERWGTNCLLSPHSLIL